MNVPNSFVCKQPYYVGQSFRLSSHRLASHVDDVVNNVKQLKPFLLLVTSAFEGEKSAEDGRVVAPKGKLFEHDPSLPIATTFDGGPIKVVRSPMTRRPGVLLIKAVNARPAGSNPFRR